MPHERPELENTYPGPPRPPATCSFQQHTAAAATAAEMVAETPPTAQAAGAIVAVGQVQSGSASSAVSQADLEQVKKLLTQTKAIGVILPPPDIRAIVDKTAQFVAKNGAWR